MAIRKLPTRNLMVIILFGAGILFFVLLSIFPNYIAYSNIENEIDTLKNQIEEQKILSPIFTALSDKAGFKEPDNLPFPEKKKLPKDETRNLSGIIQDIILSNDFNINSILTDVSGLMDGSGILKMNIDISGDFMRLRDLMLQFGTLPYLDHIENIRVDNTDDRQRILLKLWISQEV
ncbi:MAG: hypothetical protein JRE21_07285 [Deltaproteobacteria bacterium]|jgi:hypothetical protein|nr:hypothetical protein [Deltaproteobacteria bacterium]